MEIIRGLYNLAPRHSGCVLAIGNFDGVHLGHRALLARGRALAQAFQLPLAVQTFDPGAAAWFDPANAPPRISPLRDTCRLLAAQGVDRWLRLRFDGRFACWEADAYAREVLAAQLGVRAVVVGDDFRFGAGRRGDLDLLRQIGAEQGFQVEAVGTVSDQQERVSSTRVRAALAEGDMALAARLLGEPYMLTAKVRLGQQLGRKIGMPTANLRFRQPLALRNGVYAADAICGDQHWPGVANFGVRPTVDGKRIQLEVHLFADTGSLYGRQLAVMPRLFLRAEQRFASIDDLAAQMHRDAARARDYFSAAAT
jgi:riboflavin kinase/FMN adenylyltransferase